MWRLLHLLGRMFKQYLLRQHLVKLSRNINTVTDTLIETEVVIGIFLLDINML